MVKSIVVIHGVGHTAPASIGSILAKTLGLTLTEQKAICVDGDTFIEFVDHSTGDSIIEVNWADILRI